MYLNDLGYARLSKAPDANGFDLEGVWFNVEYRAYGKEHPIIEHVALSPNDQRMMPAYRYRGVSELQLAVIPVDAKLPRYGNVLILPEMSFDPFYPASGRPIKKSRWMYPHRMQRASDHSSMPNRPLLWISRTKKTVEDGTTNH